jgi:hypothetical protein
MGPKLDSESTVGSRHGPIHFDVRSADPVINAGKDTVLHP